MKKILLLIAFTLLTSLWVSAQTSTVRGTVTDVTGKPLPGVTVTVGISAIYTDASGAFSASGIPYGKVVISFSVGSYESLSKTVEINASTTDLGNVQLKNSNSEPASPDVQSEVTVAADEMEDEFKEQYVAGLLHSSNDVFVSTAGYTLSIGYFRPRGYDNEYSEVMFNGLSMNDPETGRPNFSDWGGLNDATRFKESAYGLTPTRFSFGNLGGTTDIDARPSHQRKQFKVSYAFTNRTYNHRVMGTYSTGLMKNGWSVMVSASARLANRGYVKGTPYEGFSYYLAVEKKIGRRHSISFTGFGAPLKRGLQSAAVQETFRLTGSNYYNPNWGWQEGEVRNARIRSSHEPVLMLSHFYDISDKVKLTTTAGYSFGRTGTTSLNWYNAADPRPDYYRYLPSYQTDPAVAEAVTYEWMNDQSVNQIDWNYLYQVNYLSNLTGEQSKYVLEQRRLDHHQFGFSSHVNAEVSRHVFISGGLNVNIYKSRNYKVLTDLLGGEFWKDVDQYSERDFPSDTVMEQNDLNNPNRIIGKGDVYGYDYDVHINSANLWGLGEFTFNHFDFYVGLNFSGSSFWRYGNMKNGRFPDDSYGKSAVHSFMNYSAKAGVTYKITGRHYLVLNTAYLNVAPNFSDIYLSPRIRNTVLPTVENRKIFSADLSYIIRTPVIKGRLTVFQTMFWDDIKVNSFYHDDLQTYVDYIMYGINKTHQGIELGVEVKVHPMLSVVAVGSLGNYRYTNRPDAYMSVENGSRPDSVELIYCKNFYVNGTPQQAGSLGLKFQHPKFWYANINANVFANNWVDFNPARRTVGALDGLTPGDALITDITAQTKAYGKPQFTLDASLSKSFRIKNYFININASVTNVLDNKNLVTSAFEQLRFDFEGKNVNKFPAKYYYAFGRTYYLMVSFRF